MDSTLIISGLGTTVVGLATAISTLAGFMWRREVQRGDNLEEEVEELEEENQRLVAIMAVGTTSEEMRAQLAEYLQGGRAAREYKSRRRRR